MFTAWTLRVMFYLVGSFRTSSLGDSISSNPRGLLQGGYQREPGYMEVLQQKSGGQNIKRWLIKENQISQINKFSTFLWESGLIEIIPLIMHLTYLGPVSCGSRKTSTFASLTMLKPLTVWITTNCRKFLNRWGYQTTLPASWEICMQVRKQQLEPDMEQWTCLALEMSTSRLYIFILLV